MSEPVSVLVPLPAYSTLPQALTYLSEQPLLPGTLVRVPLRQREVLGLVWPSAPTDVVAQAPLPDLRQVTAVPGGIAPLNATWLELVQFVATYYQRSLGEVALAALPPQLRDLSALQLARRLAHRPKAPDQTAAAPTNAINSVALSAEQTSAIAQFNAQDGPFLLFGSTGSGKTEVYLQLVQQLLQTEPSAQALVMVPEINLTPQLEARFQARFAARYGAQAVVSLHSGMTPAQRLASWLAAHSGAARVLLGTRMAVLASLPGLRLLVVDEEHDPSYKSQQGARYSARDLAVYRAHLESRRHAQLAAAGTAGAGAYCKVLLGSATPSLESWQHSRPAADGGRYVRLLMPARIGGAALPRVRLVDLRQQPRSTVLAPALLQAMVARVALGQQCLLLLNRRGYAPVLQCHACDWKSQCPHCSAFRVFHKIDRSLRCHHCGWAEPVPRVCPVCGNPDISAIGRGTERLEEQLTLLLQNVLRPDGTPLRIARIDADSTRARGALGEQLAQVHDGSVDVLVGTQMVAKGHDFRRVTLVAAVNPDNALFCADFRAPERLFALLMQAGGRAGRDADSGGGSELWLQTSLPQHPLFAALRQHDYPGFAAQQLQQRQQAGLPPFAYQALLRAEARTQQVAHDFLQLAGSAAAALPEAVGVTLYPPVPMPVQRVADIERAQMLLESHSRVLLQRLLAAWQPLLHQCRKQPPARGLLRWAVEVDPLAI